MLFAYTSLIMNIRGSRKLATLAVSGQLSTLG